MVSFRCVYQVYPALIFAGLFSLNAITVNAQAIRLDIEEALIHAVRSSDSLRYARLDFRLETARYDLSLRGFLPDLTIGYTQEDAVAYYAPDTYLRRLALGIDQLVYAGGSRIQQRRAMADRLHIQYLAIEEIEKELRLDVVNRYVEILKLGLQIQILEENLERAWDQVLIAEEELRIGDITRLDFVDIELAVQDQEIELAVLEQADQSLRFELKELLGLSGLIRLELAGVINPAFRGMLPVEDAQYYIEMTRKHNLELQRQTAAIAALRIAVKQTRRNWLPSVSTQVELGVAGEQFPLTNPDFSLGVNLDFAIPVVPFSTGLSAGSRSADERSFGFSYTAEVGENLSRWHSRRTANIELQKSETEMQKVRRMLEYSIRQQLERRSFILDSIRLEEKRLELQEQRQSIAAIMLEVGEITRLEYLQSGIELSGQRIDQLSRIVTLFQMETNLLAQCGSNMQKHSYKYIISTEQDGLP